MSDRLNELGIENAMTRTGDTTLSSANRPSKAQILTTHIYQYCIVFLLLILNLVINNYQL